MQQIPLVGAIEQASQVQTALAASKLRLFTAGYNITPADTLAALTAVEATFSGYTAGGYALATWSAPLLYPGGGVVITSPQIDVVFTPPGSGSPVTNSLGGWFLEDSLGNLIADGSFTPPIEMSEAGQGFPISIAQVFANLNTQVLCWVFGQLQP